MMSEIRNLKLVIFCLLLAIGYLLPASSVYSATFSKPPSNLGLVGYWSFDEGTSTIAHDFSGFGQNGTLTSMDANTDWVAGKRGKALDFDGTDDYVSVPGPGITSNTVTFVAWVKGIKTGEFTGILYSRNDPQSVGIHYSAVAFGNNLAYTWNNNDITTYNWSSGLSIPIDTWSLVAVAIEPTKATAYLCTSDSCRSAENVIVHNNQTLNGSFRIGGDAFAGTRSFDGNIDDVRIYNRTLSASEINAIANSNSTIRKVVSNKGLAGHWSLDEGTSTIAHDFSGNSIHGTLTSMDPHTDWTGGKKGKALDFDGTDDFIALGNPTALNITGQITLSSWVNFSSFPSVSNACGSGYCGGIIVKGLGGTVEAYGLRYVSGPARLQVFSYGPDFYGTTWDINFPVNTWHHVVGLYDGSFWRLYVDGVLVSSTAYGTGAQSSTADVAIGATYQSGTPVRFFPGKIDDARVYNRGLSASEVQTLYSQNQTAINSSQQNRLTDGLVGYWSFNGGDISWSSNIAYDRSGRNNNAVITNMSKSSSPVPGKSGQALSFDGVDDSVDVNTNPSVNSNGSFTYSVWLNPRAYTNGLSNDGTGTYFFDRMTASNGLVSLKPIGNKYCLQKRYDNSTGLEAVCTTGDIVLNEWTNIAFVRNYNSTFSIYRNGVFQSSVVDSGSLSLIPIRPLIGSHQSGTGRFNGNMDEFRIYDRALSADELKQLYRLGR